MRLQALRGGQLVASFFLVYYLLIAGDMYKRKLVRIVPTLSDKKLTLEILAEIERFLLARLRRSCSSARSA